MTWAVGDVHGCYDDLVTLLSMIPPEDKVVFVGDYVDRGPQVREVLEFVRANMQDPRYVFLKGNHEDMLVHDDHDNYTASGIEQTGKSVAYWKAVVNMLPTSHETKANYFAHGGMVPGVKFEEQNPDMLMWYRPIDGEDIDFGKVLVHGHTPKSNVEILKHRVNVDTGCVFGGMLTAVKLCDDTGQVLGVAATTKKFRR